MTILIGEDKLRSTAAAMLQYAPHLVAKLAMIKDLPPFQTVRTAPSGSSIYSQYEMSLSLAEADEIVTVLKKIELERGWNFTFYDRQVNLLVSVWTAYTEQMRLQVKQISNQDTTKAQPCLTG